MDKMKSSYDIWKDDIPDYCNCAICGAAFPFIMKDEKRINCPCSVCLIKVVCYNSCSQLENYEKSSMEVVYGADYTYP